MKVIVNSPTLVGGAWYEVSPFPQLVSDAVGIHMIQIDAAQEYVEKIVEVTEKKTAGAGSASQPAPVSPAKTVKPRRGRPPKSSQ